MARPLSSPAFIGRASERARISRLLAQAANGEAGAVLIGGEAGVGKTRLVAETIAGAAAGGWRALVGQCFDLGDGGLPFAPVIEALRHLGRDLDADQLDHVLGAGRVDIGRLVPELGAPATRAPGATHDLDQGSQARLFEHLFAALGRLAESAPLLIVLEDLHWADRSTRDLWQFLARRARRERWLLVATFRSDELHRRHPLLPFLAELARSGRVERIDLERFDAAEVDQQLASILGRPPGADLAARIHDRSDGNAFFVEELLAIEHAQGGPGLRGFPLSLDAILADRVSRISERSQRVLRVAATAGREVGHELLARVSAEPDAGLIEGLREAIDAQLLLPVDQDGVARYRFRHALVQEAVQGDLLPAERATLHERICEVLLAEPDLGSETPSGYAAEIAHHAMGAHDLPLAFRWSITAGLRAAELLGFAEAHEHLEHALELWDRVDDPQGAAGLDRPALLETAARFAAAAGEQARAAALVRVALDDLDPASAIDRRGELHDRLYWYLFESGDLASASARIEAAEVESRALGASDRTRSRILGDLAQARVFKAQYAEAETVALDALRLARAAGSTRDEGRALMSLGGAQASLGRLAEAIERLEEARTLLARTDDDLLTMTVQNLALALYWAGRHRREVEVLTSELARVRENGTFQRHAPGILSSLWDSLTDLGRWSEAFALLDAYPLPEQETRGTAWLRECICELSVLMGDLDRARSELAVAEQTIGQGASSLDRIFVLRSVAAVARADGEHDVVRAAVDEAIAQSADPERDTPLWWLFAHAARSEADRSVAARVRRRDEEVEASRAYAARMVGLLDRIEARAIATGKPVATLTAYARHARAEMTRLTNSPDPAAWAATADAWRQLEQPADLAYAELRGAEAMLAAGGERTEARRLLVRAHRAGVALGAHPLIVDIEILAGRARIGLDEVADPGAPSAPTTDARAASPLAALTAREREVLALLVEGRTNREIGEALFITEKTASVHVSNILGKLGVTSRGAAAAQALRHGFG